MVGSARRESNSGMGSRKASGSRVRYAVVSGALMGSPGSVWYWRRLRCVGLRRRAGAGAAGGVTGVRGGGELFVGEAVVRVVVDVAPRDGDVFGPGDVQR